MQASKVGTLLVNSLRRSVYYGQRNMAADVVVKSLLYKEYGEPEDVLSINKEVLKEPCENEVWFNDLRMILNVRHASFILFNF